MKKRSGRIKRTTKETDVSVLVDLDGQGQFKINLAVGFFAHMIEQFSRHSLIDVEVTGSGDLHIDDHHLVEDTGIALGQALRQALGDGKGITRYGHSSIPMDEALSEVAIDLSGRPFLYWNVPFTSQKIGTFDTELFEEFFRAIAVNMGATIHIRSLYGRNSHHIAESCFKAFARAMRAAITIDSRMPDVIPSTKGRLSE